MRGLAPALAVAVALAGCASSTTRIVRVPRKVPKVAETAPPGYRGEFTGTFFAPTIGPTLTHTPGTVVNTSSARTSGAQRPAGARGP